jgi:hypothetical protein
MRDYIDMGRDLFIQISKKCKVWNNYYTVYLNTAHRFRFRVVLEDTAVPPEINQYRAARPHNQSCKNEYYTDISQYYTDISLGLHTRRFRVGGPRDECYIGQEAYFTGACEQADETYHISRGNRERDRRVHVVGHSFIHVQSRNDQDTYHILLLIA